MTPPPKFNSCSESPGRLRQIQDEWTKWIQIGPRKMNMEPFQTNTWKISFPFQRSWFSGLIPLPRRSRREGTLARAWKSGPKVLFPCRFWGKLHGVKVNFWLFENTNTIGGIFLKVEVMIDVWYKCWLLDMWILLLTGFVGFMVQNFFQL